ncbi:hypothetical protein KP77_25170 [Jeotgalibacillus alimentarius]|uniref:HTH luxR-type domain-containing protein n=1 Tax=Jeotgalibacillus alimentarius TaxID=135826 RepID=A0A0C2VSJ3_9BACL|nr:HTH domain-containing protein [Jeotgalibacillus alimentarius]KIL46948.1 hypothetical protein KP77_25170 [Jeotgalibacillus alimentarius]
MEKQLTYDQVDTIVEAIQRVHDDLRDYEWMSIKVRKYSSENRSNQSAGDLPAAATAKYGIESSLPKAPYGISDPTFNAAKKQMRVWERHQRYKKKIELIDQSAAALANERERLVIEGILDGLKANELAQELNVSRQTIQEIKRSAVRELAKIMYLD